jgi:hypothetical protein
MKKKAGAHPGFEPQPSGSPSRRLTPLDHSNPKNKAVGAKKQ